MSSLILVDDDKDIVDTLSQLLELDGYEILGKAYDGKEAVELYKQHKPDVITLDMKMPEYDGMYAIKNIKKENPDAKIIILSGYITNDIKETESIRLLSKPCNLEKLKTLIGNILEQKSVSNDTLLLDNSLISKNKKNSSQLEKSA